jgi:hypothetical protein
MATSRFGPATRHLCISYCVSLNSDCSDMWPFLVYNDYTLVLILKETVDAVLVADVDIKATVLSVHESLELEY